MVDFNKSVVPKETWAKMKPGCYNKPRPDPTKPVFHSKGNKSWSYAFTVECGNAKFPSVQCGGCKYVVEEQFKQKRKSFYKNKAKLLAMRRLK